MVIILVEGNRLAEENAFGMVRKMPCFAMPIDLESLRSWEVRVRIKKSRPFVEELVLGGGWAATFVLGSNIRGEQA